MEKRIFRSMSLLVLLTVLFFAMLWGVSTALRLPDEAKQGLKDLRVTVLDETGQVLFDSERNPGELENHIDRAEVQQAISAGWGESERFSDTLGRQNYYYAKVMEDGRILRVSYASDTLTDRLTRLLPGLALSIAAALAFSWLLARRLTRSIVDPINGLDLFGPQPKGYDELLPLYRRIEAQRRELSRRIGETEGRNATITAIMENMREGLLLLDEIGRVILANDSVLALFGQKEAAGKSVLLLHRDPVFTAEVKRCLEGHKAECTLHLKGRTYQVLLNPVYQDKLNGGVVLFIDVTERQRAELQRKEFSANVSHELKTPLTTISVLSELMADGKVPPE
ncbi:MAG: PAS domain S-box protein, partial [Clostridiales bacterium]|nr:PAS domain S-box protein [Clostridiales bacterium]